jgi:stage II sporulation protein D
LWRLSDYTVVYNCVVVGRVRFEGHGWGHGIGLSQWGARELAMRGWSYGDILRHYYTGVTLERW